MKILNLYTNYLQVKRFLQIVFILLRHSLRYWFYDTKAGKRRRRRHPDIHVASGPDRIRELIEALGPTFVKFGQILADRPDVVSERFRTALKQLQSHVVPFNDKTAVSLIESELGKPQDMVFEWLNPQCVASASIGQVYEGRLKNGGEVIIKIQRPRVENTIKLDILLLKFMVGRFVHSYPKYAYMDLVGFVEEFAAQITNELDYFNEAENLIRFGKMFEHDATVHIPKVYNQYTTKKLLMMEKVGGIAPDHVDELRAKGYDPHIVAVNGANALLQMIMEEGFFHADPHPGNIFIMPGNVVCFIDFGMVGTLRPREMSFIANFLIGFVRKNPKSMCKALLSLGDKRYYTDMDELEFELDSLLKRVGNVPVEEINFAGMMQSCINILVKHKLRVPSGLFMLGKSLLTLQHFAAALDPDLPITPLVLPYAKRLVSTQYSIGKLSGTVFDTIADYVSLVRRLPTQIDEILYKLKEGKISHEIRLDDSEKTNKVLKNMGDRVVVAILLTALFIGSVLLMALAPQYHAGKVLTIVSSAVIVITILARILLKKR